MLASHTEAESPHGNDAAITHHKHSQQLLCCDWRINNTDKQQTTLPYWWYTTQEMMIQTHDDAYFAAENFPECGTQSAAAKHMVAQA